jgi:hypothetical protein
MLMLGRSPLMLLARYIILSLQTLTWVSKVAAGFEVPRTNF